MLRKRKPKRKGKQPARKGEVGETVGKGRKGLEKGSTRKARFGKGRDEKERETL